MAEDEDVRVRQLRGLGNLYMLALCPEDTPTNEGLLEAIEIVTRPRSLVDARWPRAPGDFTLPGGAPAAAPLDATQAA